MAVFDLVALLGTEFMKEIIRQFAISFHENCPPALFNAITVRVECGGEQVIVEIGRVHHVFYGSHFQGLCQAFEFLYAIKLINNPCTTEH